jgi:hypothetical protein
MSVAGDQLKLFGMARVEQDMGDAPWRALADRAIAHLAARGEPFSAEDVCALAGRPSHPNAVGARISTAARTGTIRRSGFAKASRAERHSNVMALWVGTR